jgi:hypothetical protein
MKAVFTHIPVWVYPLGAFIVALFTAYKKWYFFYEKFTQFLTLIIKIPTVLNEHLALNIDASLFNGLWIGTYSQTYHGKERNFNIDLKVTNKNKKVYAELHECHDHHTLKCSGYVYPPRILAMSYNESDKGKFVRHGVFYVELSTDAAKLTGHFLGYGFRTGVIVYGNVSLSKSNE